MNVRSPFASSAIQMNYTALLRGNRASLLSFHIARPMLSIYGNYYSIDVKK